MADRAQHHARSGSATSAGIAASSRPRYGQPIADLRSWSRRMRSCSTIPRCGSGSRTRWARASSRRARSSSAIRSTTSRPGSGAVFSVRLENRLVSDDLRGERARARRAPSRTDVSAVQPTAHTRFAVVGGDHVGGIYDIDHDVDLEPVRGAGPHVSASRPASRTSTGRRRSAAARDASSTSSGSSRSTDFKLTYFGSVLGYLWSLMRPLLLFGVLYVVFSEIVQLGRRRQELPGAAAAQHRAVHVLPGGDPERVTSAVVNARTWCARCTSRGW